MKPGASEAFIRNTGSLLGIHISLVIALRLQGDTFTAQIPDR